MPNWANRTLRTSAVMVVPRSAASVVSMDSPGCKTHGLFGGGVFVDRRRRKSEPAAFSDQGSSGQVS